MSPRKGPTRARTWQPLAQATAYLNGQEVEEPGVRSTWKNDVYTVLRYQIDAVDPAVEPMVYLSIRRNDRKPARSWRDFQRIKNQLAGPEYEGVELYPAESRLVDEANQYHLWCLPFQLPFGFNDRNVRTQQMGTDEGNAPGAVQTDPENVDLQYGGLTYEPVNPQLRVPDNETMRRLLDLQIEGVS